jgi:hypothetical protein
METVSKEIESDREIKNLHFIKSTNDPFLNEIKLYKDPNSH